MRAVMMVKGNYIKVLIYIKRFVSAITMRMNTPMTKRVKQCQHYPTQMHAKDWNGMKTPVSKHQPTFHELIAFKQER